MTQIREAVIVSAVRSAVGKGKKDGALASVHPAELSAWLLRVAERRTGAREAQDRGPVGSQQKAVRAWERGTLARQIAPIPVSQTTWQGARKEECTTQFGRDELLRPETTLDGLAKLKPAFRVK